MLLEINNLYFSYSKNSPLFQNLNLKFGAGKIIALAGESGCGKSTLLSLIYGLLNQESGDIIFDGRKTLGPKGNLVPGEPEMKFVAQNFDLMPYATAAENVGKFLSNINLSQKKEAVQNLLEIVGLEDFSNILPKYLSGGQQQRVAIARALSVVPKLLILDEPFSNLDFSRKIELRERFFNHVKQNNITLIISTHEIQDVLPWLDQMVILQDGRLIQNDHPKEIYRNPYNEYVAKLFGEVNIFNDDERKEFQLSKFSYYPTEIRISENGFDAKVVESRFAGSFYRNKILSRNKEIILHTENMTEGSIKISFS